MRRRSGVAIVVIALFAAPCSAQTVLPASQPGSTRALAMGDAYLLSSPRADALFYNPAVVDSASGIGASVQRVEAGRTLVEATGATRWWRGGIALGARAYGSALSAGVGYSMPVRGLRLGMAAEYVEAQTGERGWSLGAGVAHRAGPLTVGIAALAVGPDVGEVARQPTRYRVDAGLSRRPVGPLDIGAAATGGLDRDGNVAAGAGVEIAWWPVVGRTFVARGGVRYDERLPGREVRPSLGASFEGDAIVLEYGWERLPGGTGVNRFGVGFR